MPQHFTEKEIVGMLHLGGWHSAKLSLACTFFRNASL